MYDMFGRRGLFWMEPEEKAIGHTGVIQSVTPGAGGFGGFPGIFPGAGVSNAGWAGFQEFQERMKKCVESKECPVVWGPAAGWLA